MIEELRGNVNNEIEMLREIAKYLSMYDILQGSEKRMVGDSIDSLRGSIKMINKAIPGILNEVSLVKPIPGREISTSLEKVSFKKQGAEVAVVLNSVDKEKFVKELALNEKLLRRIKKRKKTEEVDSNEYESPRGYLKLANKFFLGISSDYVRRGSFRSLGVDLKKANFNVLTETYVATLLFSSMLAFVLSVIVFLFLLFFNIGIASPFILIYNGGIIPRIIKTIWIPILIPMITFALGYLYPSTEKDSLSKQIEKELPFATIHMSAISGSGMAPADIFKIIGTGKDYPYIAKEIRKVLNQINIYGYDLVTSLSNISRVTPSPKLSELLSGLATTISSGGGLKAFFEKRAETLLIDYKLEREKYTKMAETFMDIYITVVVAAPMVLMLLLIMMSITGFEASFGPQQLTFIIIAVIALINAVFLGLLQAKQPGY